jgi:FkbM family methyltransferase
MIEFIKNYFSNNKIETLVQIGGNDGVQDDFIRSFIIQEGIKSYILEPIPKYFLELQKNYKDYKNVIPCNYAITNHTGNDYINYIECSPTDPEWLKGCSTFKPDKNVLSGFGGLNKSIKMPDDFMKDINNKTTKLLVNTLTFEDFLKEYDIKKIDAMVLDTEGCELEILKQINFDLIDLKLIILEYHNHGDDKEEIRSILENNKFNIFNADGWDIVGYK